MMTIEKLREKIEKTDAMIIKKLALRQKLVKRIGQLKAKSGRKVLDKMREEKLFRYYKKLSIENNLPEKFIMRLFKIIIAHSRKLQKN